MSTDGQRTKWHRNEHYRQTDVRQTDGWAMTYSERERDFTFANKMVIAVLHICTQ